MFKQESFDPLEYGSAVDAKKARDSRYKHLMDMGLSCKRWVLKNQLQKYAGLGIEDGRIRDVYYINVLY